MVDFTLHVQFPLPFQHPASNRALPGCWELSRRFQKQPHKPRKSANVASWEAKIPPGSWTSGVQGSSLRHWGRLLHLSLDTAQWECRLVTVSQRALSCDWSQARQSDKNENTHTHCPQHFQDLFPHSTRAAGRAAGRGNGPEVPSPTGRSILLHSLPTTQTPRPPCLLTTSREEVAEQCGGSENGHQAQDPGPVLGGPGLPPWLPFSTSHPTPQLVSLKAGLPQTSLPTFSSSLWNSR